ncbi:MAG: hypothetical protein J6C42_02880 [Clostridia bacterium]|nr:hypothetical protein [Clostridia bacterium]
MKKTIGCIGVLCALLMTVSGCSSAGQNIMTYGGSEITENEFQFYLATYKGRFKQYYTDFSDTSAFYASEFSEGITYEDYLFDMVVENVKRTLVCDELFDELGLKLSSSVEEQIDAYIGDYIQEYAGGSKNQFNAALSQYGINAAMLKEIYLRDEKSAAVFSALYGESGTTPVTDADRSAYLNENYVRVRHIYVNNKYVYAADEDGYQLYTEDGLKQTKAMEGEELEAKNALIAAIDEALASADDFEEVYQAFSEDKYYANGYYLTRTTDFVSEVVGSAFELDEGEFVKIESDVGTHYIKRLPMDETPWSDKTNADFFTDYDTVVAEDLFGDYLNGLLPEVTVDEEILSTYSVETSETNYRF